MNNDSNDKEVSPTTSASGSGRRRGVAIGIAGGLLAGTAAGLVFGVPGLTSAASDSTPAVVVQQTDETDPSTPAPADTTAPADVPDAEDAPEMGTKLRETLQALVDDGTITAEQADAVTAHLVENRPERGEGGFGGGPGGHRGGPGGMFGRGGPGMGSEALTELLGLTAEEIHTQLHDGTTLAEIAAAQGVEVQAVVDTLVAELDTRLDEAVANGRIDQAEADEKLAEATEKITDMVNNGRPDRGADADAETAD
jgi:polyhydroxyalkanoate synthesis regulator phasin